MTGGNQMMAASRRESHAPEPGRTRRNQLPGRVEASPVAPDGQDRGLRRLSC